METGSNAEMGFNLEDAKKNERIVWIGLGLMIVSALLGLIPNEIVSFIAWCMGGGGFGLMVRDFITLKKQGLPRPSWYWLLFVPGYIWKRGKLLDQDKRTGWATWVLLALCVLCPILSFGTVQEKMIAESAKPVVTEILQRYGNAECVKVEIDDEVTPNLYSATAILSNTKRIPISITVRGERVLVEVLN